MKKLFETIHYEIEDTKILLRNVPSLIMVLFVVSVCFMNTLANKELFSMKYIALDCGFALSWISFLTMDMITKRFGLRASIKISLIAEVINLMFCLMTYLLTLTPGNWGEYYVYESDIVNSALNSTIGGSWYVVLGSATAFCISAIVNSILNHSIGKLFKHSDNFKTFAVRSYVSTAIGQLVDNLIFASLVSYVFFGWTVTQVIMCSITGAIFELFAEVIFSPIGYKVCNNWRTLRVGEEYIKYNDRIRRCK